MYCLCSVGSSCDLYINMAGAIGIISRTVGVVCAAAYAMSSLVVI